mgnify:CR=1 FL=1
MSNEHVLRPDPSASADLYRIGLELRDTSGRQVIVAVDGRGVDEQHLVIYHRVGGIGQSHVVELDAASVLPLHAFLSAVLASPDRGPALGGES